MPRHPFDRRTLLRRGLLGAAAAGTAGGLAGCESTTTPVAVAGDGGGKGILGDPTAGGPKDAFGIPLARRDYPVTLPRTAKPVGGGKLERGGQLKLYNYADYIDPAVIKAFGKQHGVSVTVTTFQTLDEAFTKLNAGQTFDVIFSTPDQLSKLVGAKHVQPLNPELVPNLGKTVWPEIRSPAYDVGSRYSVPYTVYTTGVGWRRDKLDFDPSQLDQPWDAFWNAARYRGRVGILDDYREGLGLAMLRAGVTNLNTEDPATIAAADRQLRELDDRVGVKIDINEYETLPAGRSWLHQSWSGDLVNAAISYLPKGTPATVLGYWSQPVGGPVFNDIVTVAAKAEKPRLAHAFLNHLLDADVAYANFTNYVGYQPPITAIDPNRVLQEEIIPSTLQRAIVTREDYAEGNAYLGLTAAGERRWQTTWSAFRSG